MNFDNIVTAAKMRKYLGYIVLDDKIMLNRRGAKKKKNQEKASSTKNLADPGPVKRDPFRKGKGKTSKLAPTPSRVIEGELKKKVAKRSKKSTSKTPSKVVPNLPKGSNPTISKIPTPKSFLVTSSNEEADSPKIAEEGGEIPENPTEMEPTYNYLSGSR